MKNAEKTRDLRSFEIQFELKFEDSDSIRFENVGLFEIFESAAPAVVPHITLTVQQKKLQPLHHCNWDLFYLYDFMLM